MTSIREAVRRIFAPVVALPPGTYHYQAPQEDPRNYRLHLRLEEDGTGMLIVNARTVLHLNQTAAEYAYHLIQQTPKEQIARQMASRYKVKPATALEDYTYFAARLDALIATPDLDPEIFLGFERANPNTQKLSAPLRLDCAITYQLPPDCNPLLAPTQRVKNELTTAQWMTILDKAWGAGIPHVIFTGGEPTLRPDLADLVRKAELLGQVSGLLTDGLRFTDGDYRSILLKTGLDHILFLLQPENDASWAALAALLAEDIFVAVHFTLTDSNASAAGQTLSRLAEMGAKTISLSAVHPDLQPELKTAQTLAADLQLNLVNELPVPYGALNPVSLETNDVPDGAGRSWLYVEPDGDVLDAQGRPAVRGNLLTDSWEQIWA